MNTDAFSDIGTETVHDVICPLWQFFELELSPGTAR